MRGVVKGFGRVIWVFHYFRAEYMSIEAIVSLPLRERDGGWPHPSIADIYNVPLITPEEVKGLMRSLG